MQKKRKDMFFGIHFDFHALEGETVARIYRPDLICNLLDRVRPDFVQCDTKGHAGLSSYPTNIGSRAFEIKEDMLKIWRSLTRERNIALFAHHSGLYDMTAAKLHPDWAIVNEDGTVSNEYLSPFSPYVDKLLIPQLLELAVNYDLDGAWIDGECWGLKIDYSHWAADKYKLKYKKDPPRRGDPDYEKYRQFCRQGFLDYVSHYINEVKKIKPEFEITSNWIFSAYMPCKNTVAADFLSGDYDTSNAVASARFNGRCLSARNMAWDLMSWGQNAIPCCWQTRNRTTKEAVQYAQEASEIIALGGAYAFFNIMYGGGGTIQEWAIPIWENVGQFVREREFCFGSTEVPEIAVLYPDEKNSISKDFLYDLDYNGLKSLKAWIEALQNIGCSSSVIFEYQISSKSKDYPIIIIPNTDFLSKESVKELKEYIINGGTLIVDLDSAKYFADITLIDTSTEQRLIFLSSKSHLASLDIKCLKCQKIHGECGVYYDDNLYDDSPHTASFSRSYGSGKIITMCFSFSQAYENNISCVIENFLRDTLYVSGFEPIVRTDNPFCEVITRRKNEALLINLINTSGNHALPRVRSYNYIPPLYNINITIRYSANPASITVEPGHKTIKYKYSNNTISLTLSKLDIHSVIVIK